MVRCKGNISHIPEKMVNNMFILQFVRFSNANKIFVLLSITFRVHDVNAHVHHSASLQWDLQMMTSGGKHVLLSGANLHYKRKERRKCSYNGLLIARPYHDNSKNGTDGTEFCKENGKNRFLFQRKRETQYIIEHFEATKQPKVHQPFRSRSN